MRTGHMVQQVFNKLKALNPWHFLWISIVFSELLTAIATIAICLILWGEVPGKVLIVGAVDSFFVSLVVTFLVIYFVNQIRGMERVNERLRKEIEERKRVELEKAKLQDRLQQSQRLEAIGRLAGGVAHDFNNILSAIISYCELGLRELPKDHVIAEYLRIVLSSGERAAALTEQLLAFSRKQVLTMQPVDLNETIHHMTKLLKRLLGEDIVYEFHAQTDLKEIWADSGQVGQILMNLAVNARDAMPGGGRLVVETSELIINHDNQKHFPQMKPGHYIKLSVSDTGVGMEPEVREKIFDPFYTTKGIGEGTGLGLATVYGIVRQHHGYVFAASQQDKGTTFTVYFRSYDGEPVEVRKDEIDEFPSGQETILVVEDDKEVRKLLSTLLEPHGYKLLEGQNGEEAIRASQGYEGKIDLLLTDIIMPGMNGRELADTLVKERPDMKVIFMSGYTDDVIGRHGVLKPDVLFLQKPITARKLGDKLRDALADRTGPKTNSTAS